MVKLTSDLLLTLKVTKVTFILLLRLRNLSKGKIYFFYDKKIVKLHQVKAN